MIIFIFYFLSHNLIGLFLNSLNHLLDENFNLTKEKNSQIQAFSTDKVITPPKPIEPIR